MGKKRKVAEQAFQLVVEESREPVAFSIPGSSGNEQQKRQKKDKQHKGQLEQQQQQEEPPRQQQEQQGRDDGYMAKEYYDDAGVEHHHHHHAGGSGGSRIDPETLSYLTEVCETLSGMNDPEEAQLLRSNVLEEIGGKELQLAADAASSTLIEQLLSGAPATQLMQFLGAFTDGDMLWRLAGGAFGSHVAEKLLAWLHAAAAASAAGTAATAAAAAAAAATAAAAAAAAAAGGEAPADLLEGLEQLLDALVTAVEPHVVDYATDKHATHVARALLVVLAGRDVLTPPGKKQRQRQQQQQGGDDGQEEGHEAGGHQQQQQKGAFGHQRSSLAEKIQGSAAAGTSASRYPQLLRRLVKALPLYDPQQLASLGKNTYAGPLLQAMLRAVAQDESLLMLLLPPILGLDPSKAAAAAPGQRLATLTDSHVGRLLRDDCYSHLLEVAVAVMPQAQGSAANAAAADADAATAAVQGVSLADEFFERFLKGRLLPLCCHHCANFVIQAALSATQDSSRVAAYVTELSPHLGDLLRRRRSGVVAALVAAAARAGPGPHQAALVAALATALGQLPQWQGRTGAAHLAPALMTLDTQAVLGSNSGSSGSSSRLSTPGCAVLSVLLSQFPAAAAAPFWESVGALQQGDAVRAARDPAGSRMLEAALTSSAGAGEQAPLSKSKQRKLKRHQNAAGDCPAAEAAAAGGDPPAGDAAAAVAARAALLSKLKGSWGSIVQVPAGSFLLEAVYNSLPSQQAEALVAELAAVHDQLISRCRWGPLVARKLGLEAYLRSPEEWRKRAAVGAAARKEFQQLLSNAGKQGRPAAAAAAAPGASSKAAAGQQQQQQPEQPGHQEEKLSMSQRKQKRRREEQEQKHAAADAGTSAAAGAPTAVAAAGADAAEESTQKRARLAAAALAAAEAPEADGTERLGKNASKKRKRRQQEQEVLAVAEGAAAQQNGLSSTEEKRPKKRSKQSKEEAAAAGAGLAAAAAEHAEASAAGQTGKKRKKRSSSGNGLPAAGAAAGGGGGCKDLVALLGFGGLSADKHHASKKQKL